MQLIAAVNKGSQTLLLLLILVLTGPTYADLLDEDWLELKSNHFTMYSTLSEKKSREVMLNLEAFRRATLALTNIRQAKPRVKTQIYLVKKSELSDLNVSRRIAGYIRPGVSQNTILVSHSPSFDGTTVIYHEYVHFLLRNHSGQRYPRWYDEGFAEYLASVKTTDKHFQIGYLAEHRASSFSGGEWLHVRDVIRPTKISQWSPRKQAQFYANAWLLVHFLSNSPEFKSRMGASLEAYLQLENQGVDSIEAFEQAFGISVGQLNAKLKRYVRRGRASATQYDKNLLLTGVHVAVNPMAKERAALKLAEFFIEARDSDAERYLNFAKRGADYRVRAQVLEAKMAVGGWTSENPKPFDSSRFSSELTKFDDLTVQAETILSYLAKSQSSDAQLISLAKQNLLAAWKINKESPYVYYLNSSLAMREGKPAANVVDMLLEAEYFLPSNLEIRMALARALRWAKRDEEAYLKAQSVANWTHEGSGYHKSAKRLMAKIKPDTAEE